MEKKKNALDLNDELFIPLELMFEILSRLTVTLLMRCKCVSKRWNEIIQHPIFIEMHRIRSTEQTFHDYTSKDGDTDIFRVVDSWHGLLLEKSTISGTYRVRNPATKQIIALPEPKEKPIGMRIVFLPSTNSYKLAYAYEIMKGEIGNIGFKVLSFGGSYLSWTAVETSYCYELDRKRIAFRWAVGFVYFFGLYKDGSSNSQIHCFDVGAEMERSPIIAPRSFFSFWKNGDVQRWDGKVAITHIVDEELHVRVLEDPIRQKWGENKTIPLTFLNENPDMKEGLVPCSVSPEEIWFVNDKVNAIVYSIITKKAKKVSRLQSAMHPVKVSSLTCTLVKLNGMRMQPMKKQNVDESSAKPKKKQNVDESSAKGMRMQPKKKQNVGESSVKGMRMQPKKKQKVDESSAKGMRMQPKRMQPKKKQNVDESSAAKCGCSEITLGMALLWFLLCLVVKFINPVAHCLQT